MTDPKLLARVLAQTGVAVRLKRASDASEGVTLTSDEVETLIDMLRTATRLED